MKSHRTDSGQVRHTHTHLFNHSYGPTNTTLGWIVQLSGAPVISGEKAEVKAEARFSCHR